MFNKELKQKVSELEKQVSELKKENSELKTKYSEIIFLKENPNKYDVSDKVKEGIILEKRIKDNTYPKCFLNPLFNYILLFEVTKAVILRKPHDENNLKMLKEILQSKYWEYRVFNELSKTEKWLTEGSLNAL